LFGRRPQDLVLHGQLPDRTLGLPQRPIIAGSVQPLALQGVLAALQELIPPGRQPVRLDLEFPGELLQGLPRSSRSTASIFLPADHLGRAR
jgi:hypothetical protein